MMKMSKIKLLVIAAAFILLMSMFIAPRQSASANGIPDDAIPVTSGNYHADVEGGYYYLTSDLNCGIDEHGIIIDADGVVIDGNGYKLTGNSASCEFVTETDPQYGCCGILNNGCDDVMIKNIEITGFCTGIALHGTAQDNASGNIIDNCEIHDNGKEEGNSLTQGIHITYVWDSEIVNNEIYNQHGTGSACGDGGNGIFIYAGGDNLIDNNNIHDNAKAGILTKMKPDNMTISQNQVTENSQGGIVLRCKLSSLFNISDNYIANNYGAGIYVGGPGNTLQNNVVTGNKAQLTPRGDEAADNPNGIRVSREADDTILESNDVSGNDGADIFIKENLTGCEMKDNTFSSYEGLEEVSGKIVQTGNPDVPSGTSITITEMIGIILALVALVIIGYGFSRRRKRSA
jgi:parallel beta-helix repeat protein